MDQATVFARRRFKTGPQGERLFCLSGPWARPMIVPGEEAHRTYDKCLRWERARYLLIFVLPALTVWIVRRSDGPAIWIVLAALLIAQEAARRLVFMRELRAFRRLGQRLSVRSYYMQQASWHSQRELWALVGLWVVIAACALLGAIGLDYASISGPIILSLCCVCSAAIGFFHGYLLYLKRRTETDQCSTGGRYRA